MSATSSKHVTAEQLLAMGDIGRCELIAGEIVPMSPSGYDHGDVALELGALIRNFVRPRKLGKVLAAETGFRIRRNPDTVLAPDVGFLRQERVPQGGNRSFFEGAPDLAIEVLSPSDRKSDVDSKVSDWLDAGTVSVWVVDPAKHTVEVHRRGLPVVRYAGSQVIEDEPTLPGFTLSLPGLFSAE